jgi:transcriptional regulator with XRE-family HTH domain
VGREVLITMSSDIEFGSRLRELRGERTQEDLAHAAGITVGALRSIENRGAAPNWRTACAIADALGVGIEEFRKGKGSPKPGRGRPKKNSDKSRN